MTKDYEIEWAKRLVTRKHTKKFKQMFGEDDPCWDTHKQVGTKTKTIRFGQQGVSGAGKSPKTAAQKARRASFKARHAKNIARGKMSAAYWANKVFWGGKGASTKSPPKSQKHVKGLSRRS